ncbi:MAG: ATP-binding protein, partial [Bacillota bacterium]|nr:ATP-binding protein [Bacillota bacterium]
VEWVLDENCLDFTIPSLTIQPLVENAVVHGIKELSSDGWIKISVLKITNGVEISILDNGKGMETNIVKEDNQEHMGFALKNIQERLFYHFGDKAQFTIESQIGKGTLVSFIRPNDEVPL